MDIYIQNWLSELFPVPVEQYISIKGNARFCKSQETSGAMSDEDF